MNVSRIDEMIMRLEGLDSLERQDIEKLQLKKLNALLMRFKELPHTFYPDLPAHLESASGYFLKTVLSMHPATV